MDLRPLGPEPSASTDSAIRARTALHIYSAPALLSSSEPRAAAIGQYVRANAIDTRCANRIRCAKCMQSAKCIRGPNVSEGACLSGTYLKSSGIAHTCVRALERPHLRSGLGYNHGCRGSDTFRPLAGNLSCGCLPGVKGIIRPEAPER